MTTEPLALSPRGRPQTRSIGRFVTVFLIFVSLSAGSLFLLGRPHRSLPVLGTVPDFRLLDQTGQVTTSSDLTGHVWVASFIYTTCQGPCPVIVQRLGTLDQELADENGFRIVSFTVDPQTDTPEVLARYGHQHGIDDTRWKLLTGDAPSLFELIRNGFYLPVALAAGDDEDTAERVTHSVRLVLVDRQMRVRGYYDSMDVDQLRSLPADARALLRSRSTM